MDDYAGLFIVALFGFPMAVATTLIFKTAHHVHGHGAPLLRWLGDMAAGLLAAVVTVVLWIGILDMFDGSQGTAALCLLGAAILAVANFVPVKCRR